MKSLHAAILLSVAPVALWASPVSAENPASATSAVPALGRVPLKSTTSHQAEIGGVDVPYTATVSEFFFEGDGGVPEAYAVTTSYVRQDVEDPSQRPVMFLFNGGPGASSSPLHVGAFGPRLRAEGEMVDNANSLLDEIDLVFIDPVGTGFSRVFPEADGQAYWSRKGDATSVQKVIENWLDENDRVGSPRFLAGQSYGTIRASAILKEFPDFHFDGVLLFALVTEQQGDVLRLMTAFPTMATTAYHYGEINKRGRSIDEVYEEAVEFARTDYVTALIQGGSLGAREKQRVARKMSALIGIPTEKILEKDLRIDKTTFMFEVIEEKGLRTGMLDTRVTAERDLSNMGPRSDPSLPGGGRNLPRSEGPSPLELYFRDELGFDSPEPRYFGINFDVNSAWDWEASGYGNDILDDAVTAHPDIEIFWVGGYFDLTTPAYGARFTIDQAGASSDKVTSAVFAGAHSVFHEEENRATLSQAVRDFVEQAR